jgi:HEAT repeat protein
MAFFRASAALAAVSLFLAGPAVGASKPSFAELVANLKSPTTKTRQDAAEALGKSRRREAIPPLSELVRDPEPKVRLTVVEALRELRDLSAVPALVSALGDGDPKVRDAAISALVEVYAEREPSTPLQAFSDQYDRASVPPYTNVDASVIKGLATTLKDEDKNIRREAALSIGILDGKAATPDLVAALQDPEADVRGAAATAIGKIGSPADGKALIPLLADTSNEVRNRTLLALGVLRPREAGGPLREMYEANRRKEMGTRVLTCLSKLGDPAQADLFRELVQDPNPETKRLAIEGLGRVSDASLLPAFKKDYQREKNEELRLAYSFALTKLGDHAFLDSLVLSLPSRLYGTRCRDYVLELGRDILPELYPYLNDPSADIRASLCDIMLTLGDPDAIPRLQSLVSDPSTKVADRASRAVELLKRSGGGR